MGGESARGVVPRALLRLGTAQTRRTAGMCRGMGDWSVDCFLWLMSCGITTRLVGVGLERQWEHDGEMHGSIAGLPDADAIIVLGGGVGAHEKCHAPELYSGAAPKHQHYEENYANHYQHLGAL